MLGYVLDHLAGILVQQWVVLNDQERVVVLLKDGHKLEGSKRSAHIHVGDIAVQAAEYAGIVAADEEDFVPLQTELTIDSIYQQLW